MGFSKEEFTEELWQEFRATAAKVAEKVIPQKEQKNGEMFLQFLTSSIREEFQKAIHEINGLEKNVRIALCLALRFFRTKSTRFPFEMPEEITGRNTFQVLVNLTTLGEFKGKNRIMEAFPFYASTMYAFLDALGGQDFGLKYQEYLEHPSHSASAQTPPDIANLGIIIPLLAKNQEQIDVMVEMIIMPYRKAIEKELARFYQFFGKKGYEWPDNWPDDQEFQKVVEEFVARKKKKPLPGMYL